MCGGSGDRAKACRCGDRRTSAGALRVGICVVGMKVAEAESGLGGSD